jgi:hypothetical protein
MTEISSSVNRLSLIDFEIKGLNINDDNVVDLIEATKKIVSKNPDVFLYNCCFENASYFTVISFLTKERYVTTLHLNDCGLDHEHVSLLLNTIEFNPHLTNISFMGNKGIGDRGASICADFLCKNNTLEYLSLEETGITGESMKYIGHALENNSCLRFLDLSFNDIGFNNFRFIGIPLSTNQTLETLLLVSTNMGKWDLSQMISFLLMNDSIINFGFDTSLITPTTYYNIIDLLSKGNLIRFGVTDFFTPTTPVREEVVGLYVQYLMRNRHNRWMKKKSLLQMLMEREQEDDQTTKRTRSCEEEVLSKTSSLLNPTRFTTRRNTHFFPIINEV